MMTYITNQGLRTDNERGWPVLWTHVAFARSDSPFPSLKVLSRPSLAHDSG